MSKTISINPDLFNFSSKRSRKKRSKNDVGAEIKIRTPKEKTKTLRKNHVLRFIRDQQEKNYKKLLTGNVDNTINEMITPKNTNSSANNASANNTTVNNASTNILQSTDFNSNFDESLKYLMNLTDETDQKTKAAIHNQTLRKYPNQNTGSLLYHPAINVLGALDMERSGGEGDRLNSSPYNVLNNMQVSGPIVPLITEPIMHLNKQKHYAPSWGCMKGGSLPTYRTWHNQTQRAPPTYHGGNIVKQPNHIAVNNVDLNNNIPSTMENSSAQTNTPSGLENGQIGGIVVHTPPKNRFSEIKQTMQKIAQQKEPKKMRYPKQKRTVRRTYKVGKSKTYPKVTVLVSNKTLRNNVSIMAQKLKQTPIDEVKRFLTKRGFIKVGSSAPNDVLRKMHETVSLMCGEIQNYNPDNLLYNFLHDKI